MKKIEIYTRPGCGYCTHAKRLLESKGLDYSEYDTYIHPEKFQELRRRTQARTFPQIFVDDCAIGGFEDLLKLEQQNRLPKQSKPLATET
ncbi:glutaredoxin domain-containing protein [Cycloclasticus sp. P1]|uniref:glutaredoxin domain-containing protein n=1 Tax=Cycloclasticus sp. (strain P1) TaxID=385025 RepID=UPI000286AD5A|nr:glutaredoxin domain-containing protein [Cycloclasticus sp. P1]AFT67518.1 Glutaredoxin [Cycloclasticus sp. P1]